MIALDVIGTLLIGLGFFGLFGGFSSDAMSAEDLKSVSIALIVFGVLLTLPLVVTLVRKALRGNRPG